MMTLTDLLASLPRSHDELPTYADARRTWMAYRVAHGFAAKAPDLFTLPQHNTKLAKGDILNYGLTLMPANLSRRINLCAYSTPGCRALCLNTAGKGAMVGVQAGRLVRTEFLLDHPAEFMALVVNNLDRYHAKANGKLIGVRLNVLSDIPWELAVPWLFERYPDTVFYDYTKDPRRTTLPANYHLTFSASERTSDHDLVALLGEGRNVAIVADLLNGVVPETFYGFPVVDGDKSDYRPGDGVGVAVHLTPKGKARKAERGGFVRTPAGFDAPTKEYARAA